MPIDFPDIPDVKAPPDRLAKPGYMLWAADVIDSDGNGVSVRWGYENYQGPSADNARYELAIFAAGERVLQVATRGKDNDVAPTTRWRFDRTQFEALRDMKAQVLIARINGKLGFRDRVTGHVELGAIPRRSNASKSDAAESWTLLSGPGEGRAILQSKKRNFHLAGRAGMWRTSAAEIARPFGTVRIPFKDHERFVRFDTEHAFGIEVQTDGRSREVPLTVEGDPFTGDEAIFREGDEAFLSLTFKPLASGIRLASGRAPMQLPALGYLHITESLVFP